MNDAVYVSGWSAWSPGIRTNEEWAEWAAGERELSATGEVPPLEHVDAMFKRRLSQLTRMTIQVGHEALKGQRPMKICFASAYGEISQQYKITSRLIEEREVSPANFSLSVFNTPVAALSIVEGNTEGYVACYPGLDAFRLALVESAAALRAGDGTSRLLIVADELMPAEYVPLQNGINQPYALALVLSSEPGPGRIELREEDFRANDPADAANTDAKMPDALRFLRDRILKASRPL